MRRFGLIGFPLGHSFSKKYFEEKFTSLGLDDGYHLFEMETVEAFSDLWRSDARLMGVNVTIPHKQNVIPYLDRLDDRAKRIGAVNVIKRSVQGLVGYNSDYFGFKQSLEGWLSGKRVKALVLGTGGASKAVKVALEDMGLDYQMVSRNRAGDCLTYDDLTNSSEIVAEHLLLINTTPLGMTPNIVSKPDLPYHAITKDHFMYDLVYNPEVTAFMQAGIDAGAQVKNGHEMLVLQAEKSWEIWNS